MLEDSKRISGKEPCLQLREASPWGQKAGRRAAKGRRSKEPKGTTPLFSWKREKDGPPSSHRITDPSLSSSGGGGGAAAAAAASWTSKGRLQQGPRERYCKGRGRSGAWPPSPGRGRAEARARGSALHRAPPATGGPDAPHPPGAQPRTPRPLRAPPSLPPSCSCSRALTPPLGSTRAPARLVAAVLAAAPPWRLQG